MDNKSLLLKENHFQLLKTDFYQLSMVVAYILLDQADEIAGFEAFYRKVNPKINPNDDFYIFGGNYKVKTLIKDVRKELENPNLLEIFLDLVKPKFPKNRVAEYERRIREKWNYLNKDFEVIYYPLGAMLRPFVPAFQYRGPKWIGQLLETPILNAINGSTGLATKFYLEPYNKKLTNLQSLVDGKSFSSSVSDLLPTYRDHLVERAKEYRNSTSKILFEAGFRRAAGYEAALMASTVAINEGWNGTSNTSTAFDTVLGLDILGGTMAHSFVMGQESEIEAYKLWNDIWPNSTFLVDTYNVKAAINMLILNNIKPTVIRIDSEPLDEYAIAVRKQLNKVGWQDVKIFISGDLTPERLKDFEERNIPFDMCMAGTAYVNIFGSETINAGFVYKLVEIEKEDGITLYPEKASCGKGNLPGLKFMNYNPNTEVILITNKNNYFGYWQLTAHSKIKDVVWEIK